MEQKGVCEGVVVGGGVVVAHVVSRIWYRDHGGGRAGVCGGRGRAKAARPSATSATEKRASGLEGKESPAWYLLLAAWASTPSSEAG